MVFSRKRLLMTALLGVVILAVPLAGVGGASHDSEPSPYLKDVDVPESVTVGESFTAEVTATNYGASAGKYSTISISSPSLDEYDDGEQITVTGETLGGYVAKRSPGDTIWGKDGKMSAQHTLVEAGTRAAGQWNYSEDATVSMEVTPEEPGTFVLYVRTTMSYGDDETVTDPGYERYTDQQGYAVKRYEIEVEEKPDIDAAIDDVDIDSADAERGDTVDGTVDVRNTGNREHTFFVGYSVYDSVGAVDHGSTTGAVTLAPGETRTVDADWTVPDDARAGAYDTRVSVWKESDVDNLRTRLADQRDWGVFRVREEPDIDAAIRDTDIDDSTFQYGNDVDAEVEVENTGNRRHTYFVGYSVHDEDGRTYDNDGTTGQRVTLDPGESRSVDVTWTVEEGIEAGPYDATVAVWKESNRHRLYTNLASVTQRDQFEVRPIETVGFSVSKKNSIEGFEVAGDPIPGATVRIDGQTLTTDTDGDATVDLPVDTYRYTVSADGYSTVQGEVSMSANAYHVVGPQLVRENVGVVQTNVVGEDGTPLGGNTYRIRVDGESVEPNRKGEILLESGRHTLTVEPTDFGESRNVIRVERTVTVTAGEQTTETIRPIADIDAEIASVRTQTESVSYGDTADTTVTVRNTGNAQHTYFVGYTAIGPDGRTYDNDETTGTAVTLSPGESRAVDVSWDSSEGPTGPYDLVTTVWQEQNRNDLQTELDSVRRDDAFEVHLGGDLTATERQTVREYVASDVEAVVFEPVRYDGDIYLIGYTDSNDAGGVNYVGDSYTPKRTFADENLWTDDDRRTFVFERTTGGLDLVPKDDEAVIENVTRTQAALYWAVGPSQTASPRYRGLHDQMLHSPRADINFWFENAVGNTLKSEEDRYLAALQKMTTASSEYALIPEERAERIEEANSATKSARTALDAADELEAQKYVRVAGKRVSSDLVQDALTKYADKIKRLDTDRIGYGTSLASLVLAISERQTYKTERVEMLNRVQTYADTTSSVSLPDGMDDAITELDDQHQDSTAKTVESIEQWAKEDGVEFARLTGTAAGSKFGSWLVTKSSYAASASSWATSSTAGTLASGAASLAGAGLLGWQIGGVLTGRGATHAALMKAEYSLQTSENLTTVRQDIQERYGEDLTDDRFPESDTAGVLHATIYTNRLALEEFHQQDAKAIDESILGEFEAFIETVFDREAYAREKKADFLDQADQSRERARNVQTATSEQVLDHYVSEDGVRASIESVDQQSGTYTAGETVSATVQVENTGRTGHTFFVGYSAVGPAGVHDGSGTTVTLVEGETEQVTVDWTVDQSVSEGSYEMVTAVWKESDTSALETRLDNRRIDDAVTVEQSSVSLSNLSASIGSVTECGRTCREVSYAIENPTSETLGETTADITISADGQTIWEDQRTLTEIPPGEIAATAVVDLDIDSAYAVEQNDGRVTVTMEVTTDGESRTFTFERDV